MSSEYATKECDECKEELHLSQFSYYPNRGTHYAKCKECTKKKRKNYYQKDASLAFSAWRKLPNTAK